MLFSTILNLFFIPVLYVIVKTLLTSFRRKKGPGTSQQEVHQMLDLDGQAATDRELKVS
jgi:hypothetical protein